ncbi:MAG: hypothetical protein JRN21_09215 [Nitrososphaerota archaeon]|nr:hypothetical protein [Nitrososphaerota archaeon]
MTDSKGSREPIRFFNVSQKDAHLMSMPKYPTEQSLIGELIYAIEKAAPKAAWVQFSFVQKDLTAELTNLKLGMQSFKAMAETPVEKLDYDGNPYQVKHKELGTDFYRQAEARMGKIDTAAPLPKILMAIQGMWIGDESNIYDLPFSHCYDEIDHLDEFVYKDPRMLIELIERRMVTDITPYFRKYGNSRLESPSFIITPEELPTFIHFPTPPSSKAISSINWGMTAGSIEVGKAWTEEEAKPQEISQIMEAVTLPKLEEPLSKEAAPRLKHLYSSVQRTFEILYENGSTKLVLTSKSDADMFQYKSHLESMYGPVDLTPAEKVPNMVYRLPVIKGILAEPMPHGKSTDTPTLKTEYSIFPVEAPINEPAALPQPAGPTLLSEKKDEPEPSQPAQI